MNVCAVCEFWIKVKTQSLWVRAMGSAVLFILISRLLLYSTGSGVNRVQIVFSGFSVKLSCFVQAKIVYRYGCIHFLAALAFFCVGVMMMSSV